MKVSTCFIASAALLAQQASAFSVAPRVATSPIASQLNALVDEDVDYDAPDARAGSVGNLVKTPDVKVGLGPLKVSVPSFIARTFGLRSGVEADGEMPFVDDECYLGKEGDLDECADFDPKVSP